MSSTDTKKACNHSLPVPNSGYRQVTFPTTSDRTVHALPARTSNLLVPVGEYWRYSNLGEQELKAHIFIMYVNDANAYGLRWSVPLAPCGAECPHRPLRLIVRCQLLYQVHNVGLNGYTYMAVNMHPRHTSTVIQARAWKCQPAVGKGRQLSEKNKANQALFIHPSRKVPLYRPMRPCDARHSASCPPQLQPQAVLQELAILGHGAYDVLHGFLGVGMEA